MGSSGIQTWDLTIRTYTLPQNQWPTAVGIKYSSHIKQRFTDLSMKQVSSLTCVSSRLKFVTKNRQFSAKKSWNFNTNLFSREKWQILGRSITDNFNSILLLPITNRAIPLPGIQTQDLVSACLLHLTRALHIVLFNWRSPVQLVYWKKQLIKIRTADRWYQKIPC